MTLSEITDIAVSGLVAQRARMQVTASNIANSRTTRTPEGGPYQRRDPIFEAQPLKGNDFGDRLTRAVRSVRVRQIQVDSRPGPQRFDPGHPDADADGNVRLPNVNPLEELANLTSASRAFEANLAILRKSREMGEAAMRIGR